MFSKYCHSLKSPICTSLVYSTFIFTSRLLYSTLFSLLLDSQHTFQHGSSGTWFILANCPVFGGTFRFFHPPLDLILSSVPLLNEISPLCPAFFSTLRPDFIMTQVGMYAGCKSNYCDKMNPTCFLFSC